MLKYLYFIFISLTFVLVSCQSKADKALPLDPCLQIEQTLIGNFVTPAMRGSMNFSGGLTGTVDIAGADYNDITCSYRIIDCESDTLNMNCNGALYNAALEIISRDSIKIDLLTYVRQN